MVEERPPVQPSLQSRRFCLTLQTVGCYPESTEKNCSHLISVTGQEGFSMSHHVGDAHGRPRHAGLIGFKDRITSKNGFLVDGEGGATCSNKAMRKAIEAVVTR